MCNRLIPFLSGYRLANKLKLKFYLFWDDNCNDMDYKYIGNKTKYLDMFKVIENINYINNEEDLNNILSSGNNILEIKYCNKIIKNYSFNDILTYDIVYFNKYVHLIYLKDDRINFNSYSDTDISWLNNDTNYIKELKEIFTYLKPTDEINNKISEVLLDFPSNKNKIIGVHFRHWPRGWLNEKKLTEGNNRDIKLEYINNFIKKDNDIKFYICTTDINILNDLIKLYGEKIIYYKNRFGNSIKDKFYTSDTNKSYGNIYKNLNGVVDLFLLSKCNTIIGNKSSSYSICAPLFNINANYIL